MGSSIITICNILPVHHNWAGGHLTTLSSISEHCSIMPVYWAWVGGHHGLFRQRLKKHRNGQILFVDEERGPPLAVAVAGIFLSPGLFLAEVPGDMGNMSSYP